MFAIDHCQIQDPDLLATGEPSIDVEGRARDPLSAADLFGLGPGLVLPQYPDDLLPAEAAPSHRPSPFSGDELYLISEEFSGCSPNPTNEKAAIVQPRTLYRSSNHLGMTHPKPANLRQREGRPL